MQQNHDVRVYDKLLYEDAFLKRVQFVFGDVNDISALKQHLNWADTVVWLAAFVGDPACALNPGLTMQTNVESLRNMLRVFKGRVIFPSTCSVYGAQEGELNETSPLNPLSLYAESKIQAESILLNDSQDSLIFRLGTLFGISDTYARIRVDLVLNVLTIRATLEGKMSVFGGKQYRPLLHVRDVASAMVPQIDGSATGVFNLHSENLTIVELAERIKNRVPGSIIELSESSFQDSRNYAVSSYKAEKELGFVPNWSVDDGINEVFEAVSSKRIPNVNLPRFSNVAALRGLVNQE